MKGNWFAVNRSLLEHPWLTKRTDWAWAWVCILGRANYETGSVTLTEVYRELGRHFTYEQWRHFVQKLVKDEMLEDVQSINRGTVAGFEQTARIRNWASYQPEKITQSTQQSTHGANNRASTEQSADQDEVTGTSTPSTHGASNRASTEQATESNKNLKQLKENTPPEQAPQPPQEKASKTTDPWLLRQQFAATDVGRELITCLGAEARRMKLEELERLSTLWTPEEIKAAWKQAKRDATHGTNRVFLLILEGKIALDKSFLPEPKTPARREYRGPQPGDRVKLPDNTIHEVADIDRYGNWVIIPGLDAIRPNDCQVVEAA